MQTTKRSASSEIAATAARLVAEEGLEYGPAKRRAVKILGLNARSALPGNDELDEALREYIGMFLAQTQPGELAALRSLALAWMLRMEQFHPYLGGAVWHGTATRHSDIHIDLFCDDPKSAELALIDARVQYEQRTATGMRGQTVDTLGIHARCSALATMVGVHLKTYDLDDLRGALRQGPSGRSLRGDIGSVRRLLEQSAP